MQNLIQRQVRDLIKEIAKEFNLSYSTTEEIIFSQFEFVKHAMSKGEKGNPDTFETILLRRLGTFEASKNKINYMTANSKKGKKDA